MRYQDLYDEMTGGTARGSLPGWAGEVLEAIGSGASPVVGVRHPLGFLCLPLERTVSGRPRAPSGARRG